MSAEDLLDALVYASAIAIGLICLGVMAWLLADPDDDRLVLEETFPGEWDVYCKRCGRLFNLPTLDEGRARRLLAAKEAEGHSCAEFRAEQRGRHQRERDEEDRDEREGWAA